MNFRRLLPYLLGLLLLLIAAAGAAWWYLFSAPRLTAAQLVPADTVAIATIPNAANIVAGYQTSQLRTLLETPDAKPAVDAAINRIGQKNWDLLNAFAPCLSGQSFIALTHFDPDKPMQFGFVAAMQPKSGLANFDDFVTRLKAAYPELLQQGTTGSANVEGTDYQWIQGPGAPDKICVAQVGGWIVTTWGEASLADWLQRYHHRATTPSLADNADYKKSLSRIGQDPLSIVYIDYHAVIQLLTHALQRINPAQAQYMDTKFASIGGLSIGSTFENGEIVDRFSLLDPKQARTAAGMDLPPCAFETLKFTGPDTQLYVAAQTNWQQAWKNFKDQSGQQANAALQPLIASLQAWAQGENLDVEHNLIDPLGGEFSIQSQWGAQTLYPEFGFLVKLNQPDAFKPVIAAILDTVQKQYSGYGVIDNVAAGTHHFATFRFASPIPISPTITTDGDYFGLFLTENQAVESMERNGSPGLDHNDDFNRQIGAKRNGASQIVFLDSPKMLDRTYRTALPYLSMAAMINPKIAALTKGRTLPNDLTWLAPMGTWSFVASLDDEGMTGYSTSGVGNQGMLFMGAVGAGTMYALNQQTANTQQAIQNRLNAAQAAPPSAAPTPPATTPDTNAVAVPAPAADTNAPPASAPETSTNAAPAASAAPADTNAAPVPSAADTNAAPAPATPTTNSDASPTNSTPPAGDMH